MQAHSAFRGLPPGERGAAWWTGMDRKGHDWTGMDWTMVTDCAASSAGAA